MTIKDTVKSAGAAVKNAVKGDDKKQGSVTNNAHDYNPAGSASSQDRGVPQKTITENAKTIPTQGKPTTSINDSVEKPEIAKEVVQTIPFMAVDPKAEARARARSANQQDNAASSVQKKRSSGDGFQLSPEMLAKFIQLSRGPGVADQEITALLAFIGVSEKDKEQAVALLNSPSLFVGDQKPGNLQELSLPPGAQKVREFDVPPGQPAKPETKYYPQRYGANPPDEWFADDDLIYFVLEDQTFTVLSVYQQTSEYQQAHAMPRMNPLRRVGGGDFSAVPKAVLRSGAQVEIEETEN